MYDIKPDIKTLLDTIDGVTSSDQFPAGPNDTPHVTFGEANNKNYRAMRAEMQTEIILNIDVWHTQSTGEIAKQVNELMETIGFLRVFQADLNDPSGIKRKTMRFRGVIDKITRQVYQ